MYDSDTEFTDAEISALLQAVDHPTPPIRVDHVINRARRSGARRSVLIAACALVAVTGIASATVPGGPLYGFVQRVLNRAPSRASVGVTPPRPIEAEGARGIGFTPGNRLRVTFDSLQRAGSIHVRLVSGASVRLTQFGASPIAQFSLALDSVSVNNGGSSASYELSIPSRLDEAIVRVAGTVVYSRTGKMQSCAGTAEGETGCVIPMDGSKLGATRTR